MTQDSTTELDRSTWTAYFDRLTQSAPRLDVTIELLGAELGDQIEATSLPLGELAYDAREDVLEIALGGRDRRLPVVLRHRIDAPRAIQALGRGDGLPSAIAIDAADGTRTLLRLVERPELGA